MKQLDVKYYPGKDYRELFDVTIDSHNCTSTSIGITNDGTLLLTKEELTNNSSAYWVSREIFSIDKEEFREYLSKAESSGHVEKAIKNGRTTSEELERLSR